MAQSQLIFDPAKGLVAPDTSEIREAVAQDWASAFDAPDTPALNTEPTTPAGQLVDAQTAEIEAKNAALLYLASQFNPRVAEGIWQDALGWLYFLTRKLDEPSVVTCQCSGLNGTVIPYGALAQSVTGYTLICNSSVVIGASGVAETTFRCSRNGPIEFAAHSVTQIVTTIPGWDTVNNEAPGVPGRDIETRSEFEARRVQSVAANSHGSVGAIFGTIANIAGVLDLAVLENVGPSPVIKFGVEVPAHGVTICVYGGEDAAIAEAIYAKKNNGADTGGNTEISHVATDVPGNPLYKYKILRPDPVNFWVHVVLGAGTILTAYQVAAIRQAIYRDFFGLNSASIENKRIGLASTVYASRFFGPVLAVEGIRNIQTIQVALSEEPPMGFFDVLTVNGDQEPTITASNISVVVAGP